MHLEKVKEMLAVIAFQGVQDKLRLPERPS